MVAGILFQPIPEAPKPADTAAQRLRQFWSLAGEFRAHDNDWNRGWQPLRLLPTPIARYGKSGATPEDGALFAFTLGTAPEIFLFIENRPGPNGPEWQYAWAPMTCWGLKAEHEDRPVWELGYRNTRNIFRTSYGWRYQP